jgi:hypothetical protein
MEVFTKLNAVEDEIFQEMEKIESQISEMRLKLSKLKNLGKVMNPERLKKPKKKDVKK